MAEQRDKRLNALMEEVDGLLASLTATAAEMSALLKADAQQSKSKKDK